MNKRHYVIILLLGLALLALLIVIFFSRSQESFKITKPNVIFILVDTLRADYLSTYGFKGDVSPNIDNLAKKSLVFDKTIAQSPWTKPSIASLFTGTNVKTHGITDYQITKNEAGKFINFDRLSDSAQTLAEAFQDAGYETAGFAGNTYLSETFGLTQGFNSFKESQNYKGYRDAQIVKDAKNWLKSNTAKPFFLYLHFMDVHGPYDFNQQDFNELFTSESLGENKQLTPEQVPHHGILKYPTWLPQSQATEVKTYRAAYAAGIKKFDRLFGEFLLHLKQGGYLENSIIVFTSDHGEELFEHGRWDHGYNLYESLLHVPLFIYLPSASKIGRTSLLVSLIDLYPTLQSLVGVKTDNKYLQGNDFAPLFSDGKVVSSSIVSAGQRMAYAQKRVAYREGNMKLIFDLKDPAYKMLYDLAKDPSEQNPITDAILIDSYKQRALDKLQGMQVSSELKVLQGEVSKQEVEKLKSLGYLK